MYIAIKGASGKISVPSSFLSSSVEPSNLSQIYIPGKVSFATSADDVTNTTIATFLSRTWNFKWQTQAIRVIHTVTHPSAVILNVGTFGTPLDQSN